MASDAPFCIHLVHSFLYRNLSNGWEGRLNLYIREGANMTQAERYGTNTMVGYTSYRNVLHNIPGDRTERWSGAWTRRLQVTGLEYIVHFDWRGRDEYVKYYAKSVSFTSLHRVIPRDQPALEKGWQFRGQDYRSRDVVVRSWPSML